jgi:hypothetical protein
VLAGAGARGERGLFAVMEFDSMCRRIRKHGGDMNRRWTTEELEYVGANRLTSTTTEMARVLRRTKMSVARVIGRRGWARPDGVRHDLISRVAHKQDQSSEKNHNWKGGISSDNYHYKKLQKQRYPERIRARGMAQDALRSGKITKQPCGICGGVGVMHHDDYSKPLDIRWLCLVHHREAHNGMRWTNV